MKLLVISTIAVAAAGGTWTWVAPEVERPVPVDLVHQDLDERIGLKRMLTGRADMTFVNLVVGTETGGLRTFRARIVEDNQARPVFGQARRTCEVAPNVAECWEIATLQVNGKTHDFGQRVPGALSELSDPLPIAEEELIETGDIPDLAVALLADLSAAPTDPEVKEAVAETRATHLVARNIINVRSGPGLSNPVLFKLSKGARLTLISEENGWGRFSVLDGDSDETEAWAALEILEDIR